MTEYLGLICLASSIAVFGCCLALVSCRNASGVGRRYIPDDSDRVHVTWKPPVVAITIENFYPIGASNGWSSAWSSTSSYTTKPVSPPPSRPHSRRSYRGVDELAIRQLQRRHPVRTVRANHRGQVVAHMNRQQHSYKPLNEFMA